MDYTNIPWRNARFDEDALTARLAVDSRAANALAQLDQRGGTRWTRGGYDLADLKKLYTGKRLNATKRGCLGPTSPTVPPR